MQNQSIITSQQDPSSRNTLHRQLMNLNRSRPSTLRHRCRSTTCRRWFDRTLAHSPPLHQASQPTLLQPNNRTQITGPNLPPRPNIRITTMMRPRRRPTLTITHKLRIRLRVTSTGRRRRRAGVTNRVIAITARATTPLLLRLRGLRDIRVDAERGDAAGEVSEVVCAAGG
jgi:hypothetical protein